MVGDNSFIGVSHLSQARARARVERLNITDMVSVIYEALSCGASGFTFSIHSTNYEILKNMATDLRNGKPLDLYPIIPYAEGLVRIVNEKGMIGLVRDTMSRLTLSAKTKALIHGGISAVTFDAAKMLRTYIDMELGSYLAVKPDNAKLRTILLHEVLTDLAVSFELKDLLTTFTSHVREKYKVKPGFVTRNFPELIDFLRKSDIPLGEQIVLTPFNKVGFQMNPSKESCEEELSKIGNMEVIAMSVLAAGFVPLREAVEYVKSLPNLTGVTLGVSSKEHAVDTFTAFSSVLAAARA